MPPCTHPITGLRGRGEGVPDRRVDPQPFGEIYVAAFEGLIVTAPGTRDTLPRQCAHDPFFVTKPVGRPLTDRANHKVFGWHHLQTKYVKWFTSSAHGSRVSRHPA